MNINEAIALAFKHYQAGNLQQAQDIYNEILQKNPQDSGIMYLLGIIYYQEGNYDLAIEYIRKALEFNPLSDAYAYFYLGNALKNKKQFDEAITCYQRALQMNPQLIEAYHNLAWIFQEKNQTDEAITYYQKALNLNPALADAYYNLGTIFQDRKQFDDAITFYQKALEIDPTLADAYYNLGILFQQRKQFDKAIEFHQKALQFNCDLIDAYFNLGTSYENKKQYDEAIAHYQKALQLNPDLLYAYNNLGNIYKEMGRFDEAIEYFHLAINHNPNYVIAFLNLGGVLKDLGRIEEAEIYYRQALQIKPDCSYCYDGLLFLMNFTTNYDSQTVFSEHLNFAKHCAEPLSSKILPHTNNSSTSRPLRIGYVSPDFRLHSVGYFIEPVISAHNREDFEIFCYSSVPAEGVDEVTERIMSCSSQWRDIADMSDDAVAELIRKDRIDILIDLAGHTGYNRLLLFARKPAPVQASWIGYPNTTGLATIDYKIVDRYTDPPKMTEQFYTEKLIRLPECFLCYLPHRDSPEVNELPLLTKKYITFGSFNSFPKVSKEVFYLWAEILKSVAGSHLMLKSQIFTSIKVRNDVKNMFSCEGISPERIELQHWETTQRGHLRHYDRVDIGLDTFPYNGTTTTCEAMWMGVPVITLAGENHASRVGASLLSNTGLTDLIATTKEDYVNIAIHLASDINRLQSLREQLRGMMAQSTLCDAKRFTVYLENLYRQMWIQWCESS
ncbi:MAG: tetratricopeptide repeat protein [Nitrospira sp.]|nr:tetratricopeptide repeat protein [Nitrospira sp.]